MNDVITLQLLLEKGACHSQRVEFAELFGESVVVTHELALKHASVFDWDWAAVELLSEKALRTFCEASDAAYGEYNVTISPFAKVHRAAVDEAWAVYDESADVAGRRAVREAAIRVAYTAYEASTEPFRTTYKRALAGAFVDAFLSPSNQDTE